MAKGRGRRLSPAFDLTPTPMIALERRDLAMACGSAGRYANRQNLLTQHGRFLLSGEEPTAILDQIAETVRSAWRPTMRRAGVSEADCEAIAGAFLYEGFFYDEAVKKVFSQKLETQKDGERDMYFTLIVKLKILPLVQTDGLFSNFGNSKKEPGTNGKMTVHLMPTLNSLFLIDR